MRIGNWRRGAAGVALVCHLLTTFGFPLPVSPGGRSKNGSIAFPCQDRPCGCPTSDECWKGDCCCFTLEEKLQWAEENGVEPPSHVRPLVASRAAPPPKKKSCCAGAKSAPEPPAASAHRAAHKTAQDCRVEKPVSATADCSPCDAKSESQCEQKAPPDDRVGVRWVAGVFAQKCRGEGPAGLFLLDPGIAPDLTALVLPEPGRAAHPAPRSDRTAPTSHRPPTPPPRHV